jgi:uncharacterized membrane protein YdbT with pleckstrin-like domain
VPYPSRLLGEGEEVLVDTHPHWWFLAGPVAAVVAVLAGAVAAYVEAVPAPADWAILAVLAAALVWLLARYTRWATTSLVVTSERVVFRRGVLGRLSREVPLTHLSDISYRRSLWARIIGTGDLVLESAGRDGRDVITNVTRPESVRGEIYRALNRSSGRYPPASLSVAEQIERLDDLRRRGALTQVEFEQMKARLLTQR